MALKDFIYRINGNIIFDSVEYFDPIFRVTTVVYQAEDMKADVAIIVNENFIHTISVVVTEVQEGLSATQIDAVFLTAFPNCERIDI